MQNLGTFLSNAALLNEDLRDVDNKISNYGDFEELKGAYVIIKSILRNLLMVKETYLFDPTIGVGIQKFIFEPADDKSYNQLNKSIMEVVNNNSDRNSDISYNIFLNNDGKGYTVQFNVIYHGRTKTFTMTLGENILDGLDGPYENILTEGGIV